MCLREAGGRGAPDARYDGLDGPVVGVAEDALSPLAGDGGWRQGEPRGTSHHTVRGGGMLRAGAPPS
jgi:hypothetical protein